MVCRPLVPYRLGYRVFFMVNEGASDPIAWVVRSSGEANSALFFFYSTSVLQNVTLLGCNGSCNTYLHTRYKGGQVAQS